MKRCLFLLFSLTVFLSAGKIEIASPPLFGVVTYVSENDVLHVRENPDLHSKSIGSLPPEAEVGVDHCLMVGRSVWCRVHPLVQYNYEGYDDGSPSGWVNARYLVGKNRGYVLINGVGHCDYVIACNEGVCQVVTALQLDEASNVAGVTIREYPRTVLYAESHFGAVAEEMDGYCANGRMIEDYLHREDKQLHKKEGE